MSELLIRNGTIVTAEDQFQADVYVRDEKIQAIGPELSRKYAKALSPEQIIDASGCYVLPGGIDPHTHMDLPLKATSSSDDFESGTIAALHGGTTTIIDFANQVPGKSVKAAIKDWHKKAKGRAVCDYAFHVSVTDFNERTRREIRECVEQGIPSFKTFMAYKGALMIDDRQTLEVMEEVKKQGGIVLTHAENGDLISLLIDKNREEGNLAPKFHALSRPALAEIEACSRIVDLARFSGCPLYIVHMSSGGALERVRSAVEQNAISSPVFVETCVQYLLLDDSLYSKKGFEGAKYVLSPPLRTKQDQETLWKGLGGNLVEVVATDHCPFTMKQRKLGQKDFSKIPNGVPGVEHRLELLFSEGVVRGRLTLQQWVDAVSTKPAKIFGLYPRKGALEVGADADVVVFDPNHQHQLSSKTHHMNCDYSVYEGRAVRGKCRTTVLRGKIAVDRGRLQLSAGAGEFLPRKSFAASSAIRG